MSLPSDIAQERALLDAELQALVGRQIELRSAVQQGKAAAALLDQWCELRADLLSVTGHLARLARWESAA